MTEPAVKPSRWRTLGKGAVSFLLSAGVLIVGISGFLALASLRKEPPKREVVDRVYNVEVFRVERHNLRESISSFGTVEVKRETVVAAKVAGEIKFKSPELTAGATFNAVRKTTDEDPQPPNDIVLQIDKESYLQKKVTAEKRVAEQQEELKRLEKDKKDAVDNVAAAKKSLEKFMVQFRQIENAVLQKKALPRIELTKMELQKYDYENKVRSELQKQAAIPRQVAIVSKRLERAQAELKSAETDLKRTEVRPPFAGKIAKVWVEKGKYVAPGEQLFRILDLSTVRIPVPLTLEDYGKIQKQIESGIQPTVHLTEHETDAKAKWTGRVTHVAPEADQKTRTIQVYVEVDNSKQTVDLPPGVFVHALIDAGERTDVLAVPRDAIQRGKLFVVRDGKAVEIPVSARLALQNIAILAEGEVGKKSVRTGDLVVLTNLDVIRDGVKLDVQNRDQPLDLTASLARQRTKVLKFAKNGQSHPPRSAKVAPRPAS